jgi:hypothetical protein
LSVKSNLAFYSIELITSVQEIVMQASILLS